MKIFQRVAVASVLSLSALSAHASDFYATGAIGYSHIKEWKTNGFDSTLTASGVTGLSSSSDNTSNGYKIQLGYRVSPNFSVEAGFVDLGDARYKATGTLTGSAITNEIQAQVSGATLDGVFTGSLNDQFSLIAKFGLINATVKASNALSGAVNSTAKANSTDTKVSLGFGAAYNFSKTTAARIEFERFNKLGNRNKTGESDVDLLSLGVVTYFP